MGNKIDLYKERQVTHYDVVQMVQEMQLKHGIKISGNFEVSCKWVNVVERTMNMIILDLVENGCFENNDPCVSITTSDDVQGHEQEFHDTVEEPFNFTRQRQHQLEKITQWILQNLMTTLQIINQFVVFSLRQIINKIRRQPLSNTPMSLYVPI